ncbi:hypothetical protein BH23ACT9_BH23ACT9_09580 [soil metagenome]
MGSVGRPLVSLVVVLVVLLVAELAARGITAPPPLRFHDHVAAARAQVMAKVGHADVVFVGSSMTWQGMVPEVFTAADPAGRSAFNAGLDGAVPVVAGPWLRDHVAPVLRPQTVVWGLSSLDLAPAYGHQQQAAYTASAEGRPGPLGAVERWAADASALIMRRSQLRRPGQPADPAEGSSVTAEEAAARTGADGARIGLTGSRTDEGAAVQRARLAGFAPDDADIHAIAATVLALADRGIEVVLAELPVPPAFVALHPEGTADVALAQTAMATMAEVLGTRFLPVSPGWADADFLDWTHLTTAGAQRFTVELAGALGAPPADVLTGPPPAPDAAVAMAGGGTADVGPDTAGGADTVGTATAPAGGAVPPDPTRLTDPPAPTTVEAPPPATAPPPTEEQTVAAPAAAASLATADWLSTPAARAVGEMLWHAAISKVGCAGAGVPGEVDQAAREGTRDLADRVLAEAVMRLADRAAALTASCGEEGLWAQAMVEMLQAVEDVARLLEAQTGQAATAEGAVRAATAGASSRDLAMFAAQAHDRLHWLLSGAGHPRLVRNPVWWSYAQRGHVDALLRTAERGEGVDTIILGTSQARTGIVAPRLAQATGRSVFNAAVDGGTIDVTEVWARDLVLPVTAPRRAVILVSGIDMLTFLQPPCPSRALDGMRGSLEVAQTSFASVPWLQDSSPLRLASGSDTSAPAPLRSPLLDGYLAGPEEDYRPRSQEEAMQQGRTYLEAYQSFTFCPDRFDALSRLVQGMTGRGIEVVVAAAPIRSELRDVARPGTLENLDRRIQQVTEDAGGRFLGYTTLLADPDMIDLVHASEGGAALLTDRLAADLQEGLLR